MDTSDGRIFTPEMVTFLEEAFEKDGKWDGDQFKKVFDGYPPPSNIENLKPMDIGPTKQQMKEMKVRRNDPCPCGSEKKFKKCCYLTNTPPKEQPK